MNTTIVSDRISDAVEEYGIEQQLSEDTTVKRWEEFSPDSILADHLVLDLNFVHLVDDAEFVDIPLNDRFRGKNENLGEIDQNEEMLLEKLDELAWSDVIPNFLSVGGSLTVLYSDHLKIETESGTAITHSWLRQLELLARTKPIREARLSDSGVKNFEVVADSEAVDGYFDFVDGYTHILDFEGDEGYDDIVEESPEVLAKTAEENIIAARLSKFKDTSGEVQDLEGAVTFLPQPTRLQPRPQDLIKSLAAIGFAGSEEVVEPVTYGLPSGSSDLPDLVSEDVRQKLQGLKHGSEVIKHIEDGDACVENNLWQPALGSYIHAIEWAFIAYLESEQGLDVIQKEQQGGVYYNLAGGHHSLLDEVTDNVSLSQKMVSSVKRSNQAERRWMAHHKSGETLGYDVMGLRSRLGTILEELFG